MRRILASGAIALSLAALVALMCMAGAIARRQSIIGTVLIFIGLILALSGPSAYMGGQC